MRRSEHTSLHTTSLTHTSKRHLSLGSRRSSRCITQIEPTSHESAKTKSAKLYKKLPAENALGMKFLEATKTSIKRPRETLSKTCTCTSATTSTPHVNASMTQRSWGIADTAGLLQTAQLPRKQIDSEARCLMHHTPPTCTQWDSIQRQIHARHHTRRLQSVSQMYHATLA